MSEEEVDIDAARFFIQYARNKNVEEIGPEDIGDVFALYICRYLEYRDKSFDISEN